MIAEYREIGNGGSKKDMERFRNWIMALLSILTVVSGGIAIYVGLTVKASVQPVAASVERTTIMLNAIEKRMEKAELRLDSHIGLDGHPVAMSRIRTTEEELRRIRDHEDQGKVR